MSAKAARPRSAGRTARSVDPRSDRSPDWRNATLARLRAVIERADPAVVEEVKWRRPGNPEGVPVWSHDGIVCIGNTLRSSVRLTFARGARIPDPRKLFNARLDSGTVRALDVREGEAVDPVALATILRAAVRLNTTHARRRRARAAGRRAGVRG